MTTNKYKKLNIANIVCSYPPYNGGMGNSSKTISNILSEQGHKIDTYTPKYKKIKINFEKNIFRLKPLLKYGNGAFLPQLFFKLNKYDIVYLHYPFFGVAEIMWLYKIFHKKQKFIIHYHMDVISTNLIIKTLSLPSRLILNSLLSQANSIICSSLDYIENSDIAKFYNNNKNKFSEIPFFVDTKTFKPLKIKEKNKTSKILFVGGLDKAHYFKGINILLKTISKLKNIKIKLQIVGNGDLIQYYKNKTKKLKIEKKVEFLNNISNKELPEIYRKADLFILPSTAKGEAFGIVLLEAMASGIPVIASNFPGIRTVFENNKQGLLIKPNSVTDLKNKIKQILLNNNLKNKMSKEARKLIIKKYNKLNISTLIAKKFHKK